MLNRIRSRRSNSPTTGASSQSNNSQPQQTSETPISSLAKSTAKILTEHRSESSCFLAVPTEQDSCIALMLKIKNLVEKVKISQSKDNQETILPQTAIEAMSRLFKACENKDLEKDSSLKNELSTLFESIQSKYDLVCSKKKEEVSNTIWIVGILALVAGICIALFFFYFPTYGLKLN
jgi:hypothetical protein